MQLYALNSQNQFIFSRQASKQINYICPECQTLVRLRGGIHRQNHFYHLESDRPCRQNNKSLEHINTQFFFLNTLPENECRLEYPFPKIKRIADVVWVEKKIIFEIQCSPISPSEVLERNRDYASEGFQVVWILHDHRYNKRRLSSAELALSLHPHYFTNITKEGIGIVYDQFSIVKEGIREHKLHFLPIDVCQPDAFSTAKLKKTPFQVIQQRLKWPIYFSGDLISHLSCSDTDGPPLPQAREIEENLRLYSAKETKRVQKFILYLWQHFFLRPYRLFFQLLLERCCK